MRFYEWDMRFCPSAGGIPLLLKCNYLFPFVCFCFPRPSVLYSFPVLSYTRLLATNPPNPLPISMRAYLLFTAPRGYLSFSPLHCECHGDTRIPQSAGPDPHPLHHNALTPHLHTWSSERVRVGSMWMSVYLVFLSLWQALEYVCVYVECVLLAETRK